MKDFALALTKLKRPRLLIRAAHHGLEEYNRNRDLKRLFNASPPSPDIAMERLCHEEAGLEEARKSGSAGYSVARHVDVMIAILAEMRLIHRAFSA